MNVNLRKSLDFALLKLNSSIGRCKKATSLSYWSDFIRLRDEYRCVVCKSNSSLSAHHIVRKSFLPEATFQTGNGITLCRGCHKDVHRGFNGKANFALPMDAQCGEKIDILTELFDVLANDAIERERINDDYYFLSDQILSKFKILQSFDSSMIVKGYRIEQASLIWHQSPNVMRKAIAEANGIDIPNNLMISRDGMFIRFE